MFSLTQFNSDSRAHSDIQVSFHLLTYLPQLLSSWNYCPTLPGQNMRTFFNLITDGIYVSSNLSATLCSLPS